MPIKPITIYVTGKDGKITQKELYIRENIKNIHINFYGDDISNDFEIKNGKLVGDKEFKISEKEYLQLLALQNADNLRDISLNDFSAADAKKEAFKAIGFDYRDKENGSDYQYYMGLDDEDSGLEIYIPKKQLKKAVN